MKTEHKTVGVVGFKVVDEENGIVSTIVSVTGIEDEVKDIIEPGSYAKTLAERTPKGVWSHDWDTPVSKTLEAAELLPGDPNLPKKQRNGEDWPKAAGALEVKTQFNLDTQRGREAYSDVKFFGDEQEWSIGYSVPVGGAKINPKTGVRTIKEIELFEYSPVLFGAMPLTMTTDGVKAAQKAFRDGARVEVHRFSGSDEKCTACGLTDDDVIHTVEGTKAHVFSPSADDEDVCSVCEAEKDDDEFHLPDEEDDDTKDGGEGVEPKEGEGDPNADPASPTGVDGGEGEAAPEGADPQNTTPEADQPKVIVSRAEDGSMSVKLADVTATPEEVAAAIKAFQQKDIWAEMPGTFEERAEAIRDEVQAWADGFFPASLWPWARPLATYDDRVVFCVWLDTWYGGEDWLEENGYEDGSYFQVGYTYDETTAEAELDGDPILVTVVGTIVPKALADRMSDAKTLAKAAHEAKRMVAGKAGAVLSGSNATTIVATISALIDMLNAAGVEHPYVEAEVTPNITVTVAENDTGALKNGATGDETKVEVSIDMLAEIEMLKDFAAS